MPRWWLITIAAAGAWLVAMGAVEFGVIAKLSVGAVKDSAQWGVFGVSAVAAFQCARNGSAAWAGTLAFLAALLNPVAPAQWPAGWEKSFELAAGFVMLAFSVRQWN